MNEIDATKRDNILGLVLFVNEFIVNKGLHYSGFK